MSALVAVPKALKATWVALAVPDLLVRLGPIWDAPNMFLAVGWDRSGQPAVVDSAATNNMTADEYTQAVEVSCLLSRQADAADFEAAADAIDEAFDALVDAVSADPTLGGVVNDAQITDRDLAFANPDGAELTELRFTVHCETY